MWVFVDVTCVPCPILARWIDSSEHLLQRGTGTPSGRSPGCWGRKGTEHRPCSTGALFRSQPPRLRVGWSAESKQSGCCRGSESPEKRDNRRVEPGEVLDLVDVGTAFDNPVANGDPPAVRKVMTHSVGQIDRPTWATGEPRSVANSFPAWCVAQTPERVRGRPFLSNGRLTPCRGRPGCRTNAQCDPSMPSFHWY